MHKASPIEKIFISLFFVIVLFNFASAAEKLAPAGSRQGPEIGHNFVVVYK